MTLENVLNYATILDATSNGMAFTEFDSGKIVTVNEAWIRATGLSREDSIGKSALELGLWCSEADREACIAVLEKNGELAEFETTLILKSVRTPHVISAHFVDMGGTRYVLWEFRDITERRHFEESLAGSRKLLQTIIDTTPVRVFWKDRHLRYLGCNPLFAHDAGVQSPRELIGKDDFQLAWAAQAELYRADDRQVIEGGVAKLGFEEPQTTPDGQTIWLRTSKVPLKGDDNETIGVLGIYDDVSMQKRAELAVLRESEKNRALLRNASDGIHILDLDGNIVEASDSFCSMLGYGREELTGMNVTQWDAHFSPDVMASTLRQHHESQTRIQFETRHRRKDGAFLDVEVSGAPLELDGRPMMFYSSRDITGRLRMERELRQSDQRFRNLFDYSPDPVWIIDGHRFVECNQAAVAILGYSGRDALLNTHPSELSPETQPDGEASFNKAERMMSIAQEEGFNRFEWVHTRADGSEFFAEVTLSAITLQDRPLIYCVWRDITDRKQAESVRAQLEVQLRESQKMEALGTLAGGVAHDFNNSLALILGNVELARQDLAAGHPALVSLEEIGKAGRRTKDLVQQILAFGRRQKAERKPTSLALVVVESARLIRATLPAMVSLTVECKPNPPPVLADATHVQQILLNLCANALHALLDQPRPGVIEITLEEYAQQEARGDLRVGRYARLMVRDNGIGMNEATRLRIFEPFFTTKPVGKGTGLGLAVVHGLVKAHDAIIEVTSAPGEGSAFCLYFPAIDAQVPDTAPVSTEPAATRGGGKHVLYVDDDEAIIFLMTRLLERLGYRVSGYTNPEEAIAAAQASPERFDLAVTDFNMPGMNGLDVTKALRKISPALPIVLASGYITEELRQKAPEAGVNELIYKPNTVEDLCEAVARFAGREMRK